MRKFLSFIFTAVILMATPSIAAKKHKKTKSTKKMQPDIVWSLNYLKEQGFKKSFLQTLKKHYDQKSFERVLRLNLLGFLSPPSHMSLVSDKAVNKSINFIEKNKKALQASSDRYDVPIEIISALLWVETRHGDITGNFHVPSVYLHLLQASREKNQKKILKIANKNPNSKKYSNKELLKMIKTRTEWRAKWALEQLYALEEMHSEKQKNIRLLKGSFAGAFGIPQFIPSSYRAFSASANSSRQPDLFKESDAIHSVARYLNLHGWDNKKTTTHIKALMKYNNSQDYAESIIELSKKIKQKIKHEK